MSPIVSNQFHFFNIVPCTPGGEELQARNVIELEAKTGIDVALYSLSLHPEGFPASQKAEILIESYRRFRRALQGSRVRHGVLLQSILGHWPRIDKDEEQWTRTIDIQGLPARFCPLDPQYREYIFQTIAEVAKEHPCFLLGDDDIRGFSPNAECFCELHTAEFNRRTGHCFSPEEYRQAVLHSKVGDEIFTAYERLREDTVNGVCSLIREAIDSVDSSIPAGVCMPAWELRFSGFASQAIAAKGQPPVMRIANSSFMEESSIDFSDNHLHSQSLRQFWKKIPFVLDETDTYPHTLFSKSAAGMHAKLVSAIFAGLNGSKLWYVNCHEAGKPVSRKYTEILEKHRGYYPELNRVMQNAGLEGVFIPMLDQFPNWHPACPQERFLPKVNWAHRMLGIYGIPFTATYDLTQDGIYAVAGEETVNRFTDEQIRQLMTRKLLLDGAAAVALTRRGFASSMGVSAEKCDFQFNREVSADGSVNYILSKTPEIPFLTLLAPEAEVLTRLKYAEYAVSQTLDDVAPATVLYRNAAGGLICTTAFSVGILFSWARPLRKEWLVSILDRMNGNQIPFVAVENQWLMMLHRKLISGENLLGVFNLGFDTMESLEIRCAKKPAKAEFLQPSGEWRMLDFAWKDGILTLPIPLACYEPAVIRIG